MLQRPKYQLPGFPIKEFNASQNPIAQRGAVYLARMLNAKRISTQFLQSIFLDQCQITDAGGACIVRTPGTPSS